MKTDHTLTADRLRELYRYEGGALYWRDGRRLAPIGCAAGSKGRLQATVDGVPRYVHRLVWLYHHGTWPAGQIDHINGDHLDNRIENLRDVSPTENAQNGKQRGVSLDHRKAARPWRARIMTNGQSVSLGYFDTEDESIAAYRAAKARLHPSWATGVGKAS